MLQTQMCAPSQRENALISTRANCLPMTFIPVDNSAAADNLKGQTALDARTGPKVLFPHPNSSSAPANLDLFNSRSPDGSELGKASPSF